MDALLDPNPTAEPSAEEIARMQAQMREWYLECEEMFAQMEARRPEIDRLRAETRVILDSCEEMMRRR